MNMITSFVNIRLSKKKAIQMICLIFIVLIGLLGVFAPWIIPNDPYYVDIPHKFLQPSLEYPLGTDHLGRCIFSRILIGIRYSLGSALVVLFFVLLIGIIVGSFVALKSGWIDAIFTRLCDILLAFPTLVLAFGLLGVLGPSFVNVLIALVFSQCIYYARVVRGMVLNIKEKEFIAAAKVSGTRGIKLFTRHIYPHLLRQLMVLATLDIGTIILEITGFSFIGLGVQPPTAEWGMMINEGKHYIRQYPELMLYPGLAIVIIVLLFNILGESLKEKTSCKGGET